MQRKKIYDSLMKQAALLSDGTVGEIIFKMCEKCMERSRDSICSSCFGAKCKLVRVQVGCCF